MSEAPLVTAPWPHLAFMAAHFAAGHFVAALVFRARFGKSPLVLYAAAGRREPGPHARATRAVGVAGAGFAGSLVASALSPAWRASWPGALAFAPWPRAGWALAAGGLVAMVACQLAMGPAFRVGQDETEAEAPALARGWPHRVVRHPVYVASFASLVGAALWYPALATLAACAALGALVRRLALLEEAYLTARLGAAYAEYAARVPRFVPGWRSR